MNCHFCNIKLRPFPVKKYDYYSCSPCQVEYFCNVKSGELGRQNFKGKSGNSIFYIEVDYENKQSKFSYIEYDKMSSKNTEMVVIDKVLNITPQNAQNKIRLYLPYI